jgi:23S rRNA (adenine2030-N6)-methyltransferase
MNYRHAFHAGNFADVLKHAVLALILAHLKQKPAPFRVIDTHAGRGLYRLDSDEARRTGEWHAGIGRLLQPGAAPLPDRIAASLEPYLAAVRRHNPEGGITRYPGSPLIALDALRATDRLIANELHPEDAKSLRSALGHDLRAKVLTIDAWQAVKSLLPPKERRGAILIDPPFEAPGDLDRLADGLSVAVRRFATGTYVLWLPIKDGRQHAAFVRALQAQQHEKLLLVELFVRALAGAEKLAGTGLVILNPPFTLEPVLAELLPFLAERLAQGPGASGSVRRLQD